MATGSVKWRLHPFYLRRNPTIFQSFIQVIQNSKVFLPSYGNPISKYRSKGEGSSGSNEKENKIPPRSSKHTCHDNVIMISERAWGDLKQLATFLSHSDIAPDAQIDIWLDILAQIEDAICALHLLGILHDDLHTGNVLVNPVKDKTGRIEFKIKLSDFSQAGPSIRKIHWTRDGIFNKLSMNWGNWSHRSFRL